MSLLTSLLSLGSKLFTGLSLKQWLIIGAVVGLAATHYAAYRYGKSVVQAKWDASSAAAATVLTKVNAQVPAVNTKVEAENKVTHKGYENALEKSNKVVVPVSVTCKGSSVVAIPVAPLRVLFSSMFDTENSTAVSDTAADNVSGTSTDSDQGSGK